MKAISALLLLLCVNQAQAWWGTGHLIVARIGYDLLEKEAPGALKMAESVLASFTKDKNEGKHAFVECATYADDMKGKGGSYQSGWHFIDTPYLDEGGKITDFNFKFDSHNITEAMAAIQMFVQKKAGYQKTYEYEQIMSHMSSLGGDNNETQEVEANEDEARALALRLLIHYTGDIHQPLHATSRVDHEYTAGDRGGNSFRLPNKQSASNLHAVYDSVFYEFTGYPKLPLNDADWSTFGSYSSKLVSKYPESTVGNTKDLDFNDWAKDSFLISESFVYDEINHKENKPLPADYIAKGKTITEKQLVLAGYRLKNLMKSLFPKEEEETLFLQN